MVEICAHFQSLCQRDGAESGELLIHFKVVLSLSFLDLTLEEDLYSAFPVAQADWHVFSASQISHQI